MAVVECTDLTLRRSSLICPLQRALSLALLRQNQRCLAFTMRSCCLVILERGTLTFLDVCGSFVSLDTTATFTGRDSASCVSYVEAFTYASSQAFKLKSYS